MADEDPLRRLPHRPPFALLDLAPLVEPGAWAVAVKLVSHGDPFADARGRWPAVLLAEMMAQTAGLASARDDAQPAMVAKIDRMRCRGTIGAGARLICVARVVKRFGASALVRAAVRADGRRCAAAELVLRFG